LLVGYQLKLKPAGQNLKQNLLFTGKNFI